MPLPILGGLNDTAQVHRAYWWCGGVAVRGAGPARRACPAHRRAAARRRKRSEILAWLEAFRQVLQELGWVEGRNVRIDIQWAGAKADDIRKHAAELAALAPDVILAHGASTVGPLLQTTHTVPIVFPIAS